MKPATFFISSTRYPFSQLLALSESSIKLKIRFHWTLFAIWTLLVFLTLLLFYTTFNKGDLYKVFVKRNSKLDDWQLSFLHQLCCFQNINLSHIFQTLFARKRDLSHFFFLYENESLEHCFLHDMRQMATF